MNLKVLLKPTEEWGPARQEDRIQQDLTLEKKDTESEREEQKIINQEENNTSESLAPKSSQPLNYGINTDSYI